MSKTNLAARFLATISEACRQRLGADWASFAHPHQEVPAAARNGAPWRTWLILGGRGAGKTRAGAQWVRAVALGEPPKRLRSSPRRTSCSVSPISAMRAGGWPAGLLSVHARSERPTWIPSRRRLEWATGAVAQAFSAEDPCLRGPQFSAAWADELAKWRHGEATFDMLQFGLRLGEHPRQVITTTPRPIALIKRLIADPLTALTHAGTRANARNLSSAFVDTVFARYGGTRLGRQELDGEIIEERADALWTRAALEACRVAARPLLRRIVVAIDPPASAGKGADACGLVVAGAAESGLIYALEDASAAGLSPAAWAAKAIALWRRHEADALVAEINQGGDMVRAVIAEADRTVPLVTVRATRGKYVRAEPVAALYEQGRVKHVGAFPALEDEMCEFNRCQIFASKSDACVLQFMSGKPRTGPEQSAWL